VSRDQRIPRLRRSEWVLVGYFLYVAMLGLWRARVFFQPSSLALIVPLALILLARADSLATHRNWSIVRDWFPALLVLLGYWSIDAVTAAHGDWAFENKLVGWDRTLLNDWDLRAAIERFGAVIPAIVEVAYSLLYAVLPLTIAGFYLRHKRDRLDDFMFPFLLGTLATYALLPHYPSEPPRVVFDGYDSVVETPFRRFNLWILNHADIRSSVFPSGHVAVGFSAAFAMWLAVPERPVLGWALMALAMLVWVCTVYGRYHYAADGLASAAVTAAATIAIVAHRAQSAARSTNTRV
jgi:membrane-associated phospholipid phosphatase